MLVELLVGMDGRRREIMRHKKCNSHELIYRRLLKWVQLACVEKRRIGALEIRGMVAMDLVENTSPVSTRSHRLLSLRPGENAGA